MTLSKKTLPRAFSKICSSFFLEQLFHKQLYLFSYSSNYCCSRAAQWQVSKFTWRNTVTSSRTLVKSHKALEGTERFADLKDFTKSSPKRNYYEVLSLPQNLQFH